MDYERPKREPKTYTDIGDLPLILTVYDLMDFFGWGYKKAYTKVHEEGFPAFKDGANIRVPKWMLVEWIEKQVKEGAAF